MTPIPWKVIGYAVLGVLVLVAVGFLLWNFDPFGRRKVAEQKAATATIQATQAQGTTAAVDRYHTQTIVIRDKVDQEYRNVQALPDASTALSPERRAALCSGLGRMRNSADPCGPLSTAEPAPAL